jgi:hypothetical protein
MIANPDFSQAGATAGQAAAWTLRSSCARESVAGFAATPPESVEGFERWSTWLGALGTATFAPFVGNETMEVFDGWPNALFAFELSEGLVQVHFPDGFETGWWTGNAYFAWAAVPSVAGVFATGSMESFDKWRPADVYLLAFNDAALKRAVFHGEAQEMFDAWTTTNTTL